MIEERVQRLRNEIKSLKTSMPVGGSLLDTYFYSKTIVSNSYPDGATVNYRIKFNPVTPADGLGMTELFEYCEGLADNSPWSDNNPVFLAVNNGYFVDSNGSAVKENSFFMSNFGTFKARITAAVYSTVPGNIEITFY